MITSTTKATIRNRHRYRRGITLIEVIVVIAIIGLLLSLMLPAVQHARGVVRRMSCSSRLRQLGIALTNYESSYGVFPFGLAFKSQLLPFIDQAERYTVFCLPESERLTSQAWNDFEATPVTLYLCPSDAASSTVGFQGKNLGAANYAACFGSGVKLNGFNGMFNLGDIWPTSIPTYISASHIVDGLSNTVAMSEMRHADLTWDRYRTVWKSPVRLVSAAQVPALISQCDAMPEVPSTFGWQGDSGRLGVPWYNGDCGRGMYNHMLPPNRPSCTLSGRPAEGNVTATSFHSGGVNALFADGSVRFISNTVDVDVWGEMGSRTQTDDGASL